MLPKALYKQNVKKHNLEEKNNNIQDMENFSGLRHPALKQLK